MKVETIFASNSQVVMNIRIMLFIVMMMVMPVSYAACYSELSVQHNLVVQGILHLLKHKWRSMSIILMIRHA